jgi:hypothetical protein
MRQGRGRELLARRRKALKANPSEHDLAERGKAQSSAQVQQRMRRWQTDDDLASFRTRDALARLLDEERKQ